MVRDRSSRAAKRAAIASDAARGARNRIADAAKKVLPSAQEVLCSLDDMQSMIEHFRRQSKRLQKRNELVMRYLRAGEPEKTLNYEQAAAQGPQLKIHLTVLQKFLPKNWEDFYTVGVEVWSRDHEGCIPSSMNYDPRNVDEHGFVEPFWGEFCADHPEMADFFHPFTGREIRYCLESALSTNKIDRWAGDNEVQVIVECNDFL